MVGDRLALLAPSRQFGALSAAHARQAGRTAADGRYLSDAVTRLPGILPALPRRIGATRLLSVDSRFITAPPGKAMAREVLCGACPAGLRGSRHSAGHRRR